MIIQMTLATEYFEKISNEEKSIECRLYDNKRRQLNINDQIEFSDASNPEKKVSASIVGLYKFTSFYELLNQFPIAKFGAENKEQFLSVLRNFYSNEDETRYGVVGIEIKLIRK